ncbi:MAG: hypothetical protein ACFWUC_08425 [Oscillospiraceae bacterium]
MSFVSAQFLLFFPIVTIVYYILPQKKRWIWLLAASYFFYMCWNAQYGILLALSTVITYFSGILIAKANHLTDAKQAAKMKKIWVTASFVLNLGILIIFKYLKLQ